MTALQKMYDIRDRECEIQRQKEKWLRSQGWKESSDYPGSMWLWSKEFPQSDVQWVWEGKNKVPHPGFLLSGVSLESAITIECAWLDLWTRDQDERP